jgi:hypothetical protein
MHSQLRDVPLAFISLAPLYFPVVIWRLHQSLPSKHILDGPFAYNNQMQRRVREGLRERYTACR